MKKLIGNESIMNIRMDIISILILLMIISCKRETSLEIDNLKIQIDSIAIYQVESNNMFSVVYYYLSIVNNRDSSVILKNYPVPPPPPVDSLGEYYIHKYLGGFIYGIYKCDTLNFWGRTETINPGEVLKKYYIIDDFPYDYLSGKYDDEYFVDVFVDNLVKDTDLYVIIGKKTKKMKFSSKIKIIKKKVDTWE